MDLQLAILQEIYRAAERLGAGDRIREIPHHELYSELEALGADRHLLGIVGSWGDCMTEAQVLAMLKAWNVDGRLEFERLYASTSDPEAP